MRDIVIKVTTTKDSPMNKSETDCVSKPEVNKPNYGDLRKFINSYSCSDKNLESNEKPEKSFQESLNSYRTKQFRPVKLPLTNTPLTNTPETLKQKPVEKQYKTETAMKSIPEIKPKQKLVEKESEIITKNTLETTPKRKLLEMEYKTETPIKINDNLFVPPPPPPLPMTLPSIKPKMSNVGFNNESNCNNGPNVQEKYKPREKPKEISLKDTLLQELKAKHPKKEYEPKVKTFPLPIREENLKIKNPINEKSTNESSNKNQIFKTTINKHHEKVNGNIFNTKMVTQKTQNEEITHKTETLKKIVNEKSSTKIVENNNMKNQTTTSIPINPDGTINKEHPMVKSMVYGTLRNFLGAYNGQANQLANKHQFVVQDKGVRDRIENMSLSGNLHHLNGRTNPKETE